MAARSGTKGPVVGDRGSGCTAPRERSITPLDPGELRKIGADWRATNCLSVVEQVYLYDNPLFRKPLKPEHVKPRLLGVPGHHTLASTPVRFTVRRGPEMAEQVLPINIYRSDRRLMVATRAPGLEPENIRIELQGLRLSVTGTLRGLGQAKKPGYVKREWSVGPYQRIVDLPSPVDSARANASYDNGVLVLIFPLSSQPISGTMALVKVGTAKGQRIRHVGKDLRPVSVG